MKECIWMYTDVFTVWLYQSAGLRNASDPFVCAYKTLWSEFEDSCLRDLTAFWVYSEALTEAPFVSSPEMWIYKWKRDAFPAEFVQDVCCSSQWSISKEKWDGMTLRGATGYECIPIWCACSVDFLTSVFTAAFHWSEDASFPHTLCISEIAYVLQSVII